MLSFAWYNLVIESHRDREIHKSIEKRKDGGERETDMYNNRRRYFK